MNIPDDIWGASRKTEFPKDVPNDLFLKAQAIHLRFVGCQINDAECVTDIARALLSERESATKAERERCAQVALVCDTLGVEYPDESLTQAGRIARAKCFTIAAAIRKGDGERPPLTSDNVQTVWGEQSIPWYGDADKTLKDYDTQHLTYLKESLAYATVGHLLASNSIKFELAPIDNRTRTRRLICRLLVLNNEYAQTFEDRINENVVSLMNGVFDDAKHEIDQWGAFYRVETITKTDAKRLLAEGLHRVIKWLKKGE